MATKEELQKKLDKLRKDKRAYQHGTSQFIQRVKLEQQLDMGIYDRERRN